MYPCRILIIDDDIDDKEILSDALLQSGFNSFHYVSSAEKAIAYLKECLTEAALPKLIVIDLYLQGTNGLQFLKGLKVHDKYNKINIVVFSTLRLELVLEFDKNIGVANYIEKPSCYKDYLKVAALLNLKSAA